MTTFEDGPARGKTLSLQRAPFFLRVTELCLPGNDAFDDTRWDALDMIADEPRAGERLHAYQLTARPLGCFVRASGGRGGFRSIATYKLVEKQPTDAEMRTREAWVRWVEANKHLADDLK